MSVSAIRVVRMNALAFRSRFRQGQTEGLRAGARVIQNQVKRNLAGGYTSSLKNHGDFVTGLSLSSVTIGEPQIGSDKNWIVVGTALLYNLFWELGHHNVFTRHYERDEKWAPAARTSRPAAIAAFNRVFKRVMEMPL